MLLTQMVPHDQPAVAFDMVRRFLFDQKAASPAIFT